MTEEQEKDTVIAVSLEMGCARGLSHIMNVFDKTQMGIILSTGHERGKIQKI